uniref:Uncharacterized protein n=1 Tax=Rhizophora mucronata TaxID=61149 RepID=A0A2P2NI01_RHIMU
MHINSTHVAHVKPSHQTAKDNSFKNRRTEDREHG